MIFGRSKIYMDYAAGAPMLSSVSKVVSEANKYYANPSSYSSLGTEARKKINEARSIIANFLGSFPNEVVFTSSASEANSLALLGLGLNSGDIILTTPIEHPSVLSCMNALKSRGIEVEYLSVNEKGIISLEDLRLKLALSPKLVSIMYANNEIGSIQPILEVSKMISGLENRPMLHVDACQASGYLPMNVRRINADLLVFNGSKIGGPRGSGVLFVKSGIKISPQTLGGDQEFGLRAGTENTQAILGLAEAIKNIRKDDLDYVSKLRDYGIELIQKDIPEAILNGPIGNLRLPNNINISLPNVDSDSLLAGLDRRGVVAGSGAACTSKSVEPSHVLKSIGVPDSHINGTIRISFGPNTKMGDIKKTVASLKDSFHEILNIKEAR